MFIGASEKQEIFERLDTLEKQTVDLYRRSNATLDALGKTLVIREPAQVEYTIIDKETMVHE